ncbi:hypothetical protein Mgra_00000580, partial [Meloidogyne graminicola]
MEQTINSLEEKNTELNSELEQLRKETNKLARFVLIPNKISYVYNGNSCCEKNCINKNLNKGSCISKNGYINVQIDGKIKYYLTKEKENKWISLHTKTSVKRADCYSQRYSLFYFEVKMIKETDNFCYAGIGYNNDSSKIYLYNGTGNWNAFQKFSWKDGDVFGSGVVFQPNEKAYIIVFFTKNGQKIGNPIFLEEIDHLYPFIGLKACSVETNFGYDLATKPFVYDV